jgi:hypothetical protein
MQNVHQSVIVKLVEASSAVQYSQFGTAEAGEERGTSLMSAKGNKKVSRKKKKKQCFQVNRLT